MNLLLSHCSFGGVGSVPHQVNDIYSLLSDKVNGNYYFYPNADHHRLIEKTSKGIDRVVPLLITQAT